MGFHSFGGKRDVRLVTDHITSSYTVLNMIHWGDVMATGLKWSTIRTPWIFLEQKGIYVPVVSGNILPLFFTTGFGSARRTNVETLQLITRGERPDRTIYCHFAPIDQLYWRASPSVNHILFSLATSYQWHLESRLRRWICSQLI